MHGGPQILEKNKRHSFTRQNPVSCTHFDYLTKICENIGARKVRDNAVKRAASKPTR